MSNEKKVEPLVFEKNSFHEIITQDGRFRVEMKIISPQPLDAIEGELAQVCGDASNEMLRLAKTHVHQQSDDFKLRLMEDRKNIIGLFEQPIYVQEIENSYAPGGRPWFLITTTIGHFKIGWRSRVLHVEWTLTDCKASAVDLFPDENVTKGNQLIHAWSLEKAREYIARVTKHAIKENRRKSATV